MKFKITFIFIILFIMLILTSCFPVSLKKVSISQIKIQLIEKDSRNKAELILPGPKYYALINIITGEGKEIINPNLNDLIFNSPNDSIKYSFDMLMLGSLILTFKDDYLFALYEDFNLIISSKYNQNQQFSFSWAVDWYNQKDLTFVGQNGCNGLNGVDGTNGSNGRAESPNGKDGTNGSDGGDGGDGDDRKTAFFDMAYYKAPREIPGYYHD